MNICKYCDLEYKTKYNLARHQKTCKNMATYEGKLEAKIVNLEELVLEKDNTILNRDNTILELRNEINELKQQLLQNNKEFTEIAKSAHVQVTNNSFTIPTESALKYITKHFPNAPVLERKDVPKLLEYDNSVEPDRDRLAEEWICAEKNNSLVPFVGKIIVNLYKPDDPTLQPVWNSDVERLTFYRRALNDKKIATWVSDKKGIDTCSEIIKPMVQHIEQQLVEYTTKHPTPEELIKYGYLIAEHVDLGHKIIQKIRDGQLETAVLKYCAPHFFINKSIQQQIQLDEKPKTPLPKQIN